MVRSALVLAAASVAASSVQAGITITSVDRSAFAKACVTAPPAGPACITDSGSNSVTGSWSKNALREATGESAFGSVSATAQAVQNSNVAESGFLALMSIYAFVSASGDTSGSAESSNVFEVRFTTPADVDLNLNTTMPQIGAFVVSVKKAGGSSIYSSVASDLRVIPLNPGAWIFRISGGDSPSCGPCFASITGSITASVTFTFGPCLADFNADTLVDDADFSIFAVAYDALICPNFPDPCTGDINKDGYVDDSDFQLFAVAYNELLCP